MKTILILGSAPDAMRAPELNLSKVTALVALNNAWTIRPDWTHAIYPEDFAAERSPAPSGDQAIITYTDYVPANNAYGGIIYTGATMAFTAAYWALDHFNPDLLLFLGCDMIYGKVGKTHFYGNGDADPLRDDPTLQSLEAKSNRLMALAAKQNCACGNLSELPESRLTFPRLQAQNLLEIDTQEAQKMLGSIKQRMDEAAVTTAQNAESHAAIFHETGDYWRMTEPLDRQKLATIDALWLAITH